MGNSNLGNAPLDLKRYFLETIFKVDFYESVAMYRKQAKTHSKYTIMYRLINSLRFA